jgi:hypothetical protein
VTRELDQLATAIEHLRRLNADLRRTVNPGQKWILSERQRIARLEVLEAFQTVRIAANAGDADAREFLTALE